MVKKSCKAQKIAFYFIEELKNAFSFSIYRDVHEITWVLTHINFEKFFIDAF